MWPKDFDPKQIDKTRFGFFVHLMVQIELILHNILNQITTQLLKFIAKY